MILLLFFYLPIINLFVKVFVEIEKSKCFLFENELRRVVERKVAAAAAVRETLVTWLERTNQVQGISLNAARTSCAQGSVMTTICRRKLRYCQHRRRNPNITRKFSPFTNPSRKRETVIEPKHSTPSPLRVSLDCLALISPFFFLTPL